MSTHDQHSNLTPLGFSVGVSDDRTCEAQFNGIVSQKIINGILYQKIRNGNLSQKFANGFLYQKIRFLLCFIFFFSLHPNSVDSLLQKCLVLICLTRLRTDCFPDSAIMPAHDQLSQVRRRFRRLLSMQGKHRVRKYTVLATSKALLLVTESPMDQYPGHPVSPINQYHGHLVSRLCQAPILLQA